MQSAIRDLGRTRSRWTAPGRLATICRQEPGGGSFMASQSIDASRHNLSVGSVFGRSFAIIKDNPIATLGIAFVLMALPQLVISQIVG
ncbi:MAG: hypothetical protein EOP68_17910, partial [Sphingomonas sp.]